MSALEQALADYLRLRRSLGHEMAEAGWLLPGLVAYLDAHGLRHGHGRGGAGLGPASTEVTGGPGDDRGATADDSCPRLRPLPGRHRRRHRGAAAGPDAAPGTLAAAVHLLRSRHRRAAGTGPPAISAPLRAATYQTLIGLLAASGLRIGEAIKLDRSDVDWAQGVLLIRESKFGKSRLVPLHPSSMEALQDYARLRDQLQPQPAEPAFFVSLNRKRLLYAVVQLTFRQLINNAGVGVGALSPPRLHDLQTYLRGPNPARLVSGRRGRAGQDSVAVDLPGPPGTCVHLLVPVGGPGTACAGRRPAGHRMAGGAVMTLIAPTLQAFFTDRLVQQRQASPQTIASYRDTLRLLLTFVHQRTGTMPAQLDWDDLDATTIYGVPEPPRKRAAQQHQDPQPAPDSDPFAVLLRRLAPPRARTAHPACAGDPPETVRQADRDVPDRHRGRCAARRTGSRPAGKAGETGP